MAEHRQHHNDSITRIDRTFHSTTSSSLTGFPLDPDEAVGEFSYFLGLGLDSVELNEDERREVLETATEKGVTYHDSVYVKCSKKTGTTLVTGHCGEIPRKSP